jgi:thioredoxin reductase
MKTDVLIIGGGPSGLSAALTLVRQNHTVLVFDTNESRSLSSIKLHGVQGFDHKSPSDVLSQARAELLGYKDFRIIDTEIVEVKKIDDDDGLQFVARDVKENIYQGRRVILATGVYDCFPNISGYAEAWGKGMYVHPASSLKI